jgi:hypothetical protein
MNLLKLKYIKELGSIHEVIAELIMATLYFHKGHKTKTSWTLGITTRGLQNKLNAMGGYEKLEKMLRGSISEELQEDQMKWFKGYGFTALKEDGSRKILGSGIKYKMVNVDKENKEREINKEVEEWKKN